MASAFARILQTSVIAFCYYSHVLGNHRQAREAPPSFTEDWQEIGQEQLRESIANGFMNHAAKNIILFIGDGMGPSTVTAARIHQTQSRDLNYHEGLLTWEKFPYTSVSRTYNTDHHVADSASTATAIMCGEKTRLSVIGVGQHTIPRNCTSQKGNELKSILKYAQDEGKWTGVVTTTRMTHATPSATYAHTCYRNWEADGDIPESERGLGCDDIAKQLVDSEYGKNIRVLFGGGRRKFRPSGMVDPEGGDQLPGERLDGRDLTQDWLSEKLGRGINANNVKYVTNQEEFDAVDPTTTEYVMGLFEADLMNYEVERQNPEFEQAGEPSISEMTEKAIRILKRGDKGFFLLIEGGMIDYGHHSNWALKALTEAIALSDAVQKAVELTDESDTMIVVTADHSHPLSINGYANIKEDILHFSDFFGNQGDDDKPYTTLSYTNGPGWLFHRNGTARRNLTNDLEDGTLGSSNYMYDAGVPLPAGTHSGEDVVVYARGPMAHLFKGVKEENFIAHAMMYASCVGINKELCENVPEIPGCVSAGLMNRCDVVFAGLIVILFGLMQL